MHLVFKFQRLFLIKWINYDKYHSLFLKQSFPYDILSPTLACSESNICTFYVFANKNAHILLLFQGLVIIVAGVSFWFLRKNVWRDLSCNTKHRKQAVNISYIWVKCLEIDMSKNAMWWSFVQVDSW